MTNIILTDRKNTSIEVIRIMRYQVSLSAEGLKNIAKLGKGVSDPYAIVTLHSGDGTVKELGRTESIKNCLNPRWAEPIYYDVTLDGDEDDEICIDIYDDNGEKENAIKKKQFKVKDKVKSLIKDAIIGEEKDELMASVKKVTMNEMVEVKEKEILLPDDATLTIRLVESIRSDKYISFQLRALNVKNIEKGALGLGRTDPYVEITKAYNDQVVYRSDKKDDHLNPLWKESGPIDLEWFCDGDRDLALKITLWDYQSRSEDRKVGLIQHVTAQLITEHVTTAGNGDMTNVLKFKKKERDVGDLIILKAKIE